MDSVQELAKSYHKNNEPHTFPNLGTYFLPTFLSRLVDVCSFSYTISNVVFGNRIPGIVCYSHMGHASSVVYARLFFNLLQELLMDPPPATRRRGGYSETLAGGCQGCALRDIWSGRPRNDSSRGCGSSGRPQRAAHRGWQLMHLMGRPT